MPTPEPPLNGIRVLDLSRMVSGPLCTRILSDLGADVIKVEEPVGDMTRIVGPTVNGHNAYYTQMNAGKRNVSMDLKADGARDLLRTLISKSDVLVQNYRPGVLDRLIATPEQLTDEFPQLIICSISGWGQHGPWRTRPAYAPYVHAEIGMVEMTSRLRGTGPAVEVHQHADTYAALMAANAITTALFHRTHTGSGTHIDLNMAQAAVYADEWAAVELLRYDGSRKPFDSWMFPVVELADGTPVSLMGDPAEVVPYWVQVLGDDDDSHLLEDPRFATAQTRAQHREDLLNEVKALISRIPDAAALNTALADHPLLGTRVRSLADLADSPWANAIGLVAEAAPGVPVPHAPWTADSSIIGVHGPAADRGADNVEVLSEIAGLDEHAIDMLAKDHVISSAE
ncbi:MAG: hypothetical protein QOI39_2872 [Mycobacterium sp.]|jgi:crotonobetainyl-CoA:carnitine CoA-transferase CaiB-like acyl-CoA transferase|nr:hypothetical protein [Mycobacterium sp.]